MDRIRKGVALRQGLVHRVCTAMEREAANVD